MTHPQTLAEDVHLLIVSDNLLLADVAGAALCEEAVITSYEHTRLGEELSHLRKTQLEPQVVILDGNGRVDRVVAAHDVGKAINPALCEGQIEGSVHMGLGYALTEELPCPNGMPATFKLRELGPLRAKDMPEIEVLLVEEHEPEGPFGAKGVGEIGLVPTAGAVAGALAAFDGERRRVLPMKDSPAARAMSVGRIRRNRGRKG